MTKDYTAEVKRLRKKLRSLRNKAKRLVGKPNTIANRNRLAALAHWIGRREDDLEDALDHTEIQ